MAVKVTPIGEQDLPEVCKFLNRNLNARISADDWERALTHPWSATRPNYGAQLRDGANLVGVFCAIYSDQDIDGRTERFCNPHSWCVLPEYRTQGVGLALYLTKQRGYHFTMLTPNPKVTEIFLSLGFKMLDDRITVFPNLPMPSLLLRSSGRVIETDLRLIPRFLSGATLRDFDLHRDIPWLRFAAFGQKGDICLVAYKADRWKRLPSARVIHVSDSGAFQKGRRLLQHYLLMRHGLATTHIESRFLSRAHGLKLERRRTQAKLFSSATLTDSQVRDFYTELAALDV